MTPDELNFVAELARVHAGVVLRPEKAFFVETRLGPVARREKLPGVSALLEQLRQTKDLTLAKAVVEATLMQETGFFRDRAVFEHLRTDLVPKLTAARGGAGLRILSAGCATGQEAYSIAMLASDAAPDTPLDVVGLDYSGRALEKARSGLYTHFEVQRGLPIRRLLNHFEKVEDNWRVRPRLRQSVQWCEQNLLDDLTHLGAFDLILCRNVLGAFAPDIAGAACEALDQQLAADGVLVLGGSEEIILPAAFSMSGPQGVWRRNASFVREAIPA